MTRGIRGSLSLLLVLGAWGIVNADDAPGATVVKVLQSGIPHAAFFGLSFDGDKGVAVGVGGAIYESEDGGMNWKSTPPVEPQLALLSVSRRGDHTIAVGQMGLALVEDTPGVFKKYDTGIDHRLLSVSVNASGVAVAGGEFGTVIKSTDGGHTWAPSPPDWASMALADTFGTGEPTIYGVDVSDAGVITVAGEFGVMARSEDGGKTWKVIRAIQASAPTIFAISIAAKGDGNSYAVGQTGEILVSTDGGLNWSTHSVKADANLLGVAGLKDGRVVITGMRAMLESADSGSTWNFVVNDDTTTEWYQAVRAVPTANKIIAVGHNGRIIEIGS